MFERFSDEARQAIVLAQQEAAEMRHGWIGTEHLLLGVLRADGGGARLLNDLGVDLASVRDDVVRMIGRGEEDIDPDALATLGIDLDAVRERVEKAFGAGALSRRGGCRGGTFGGHVPFTPRAKKALELTLREGIALGICAPSTSSSACCARATASRPSCCACAASPSTRCERASRAGTPPDHLRLRVPWKGCHGR
jgi:hypothetical protein